METIYYTIENGHKQLLSTGTASVITNVSDYEREMYRRILGHPVRNLFVNIDGNDYQISLKRQSSLLFDDSSKNSSSYIFKDPNRN